MQPIFKQLRLWNTAKETTMKLILVLALVILSQFSYGQMTFTNTQSPSQLVQNVLLGTGITVSNITVNGSAANALVVTTKIGYFEDGNSTFPIAKGVVMSSGNVTTLSGVSSVFSSSIVGGGSDPDLVTISGVTINDANVLEFDFVAIGDSMNFKYIFGSEEYPEFVGGTVNDAFGFFLSGPGITGTYTNNAVNLAIIPGTTTAVSINTVNQNVNTAYYTSNAANFYGTSSVLDGFTVVLIAATSLQCGGIYHIKLAIGDGGDSVYDSAVFLEAESFSSNVVTIDAQGSVNTGSFTDTILAEGCVSTDLLFIRPEIYTNSAQTFNVTLNGTATSADFISLPSSVFFPIGVDTVTYTLTPIADGITEPMEWLQIKGYSVTVCGDTIYDSLTIYVVDHYDFSYSVPDTVLAICVPDTPQVAVTNIQGSIGPFQTQWSWGDTINPAFMPNNGFQPDTILYTITVLDFCGWAIQDTVILVVDSLPPAFYVAPGYLATYNCVNVDQLFTAAVMSPTIGPYTFSWNNGTVGTTSTLLDNNVSGDTIDYTVSLLDGCGTIITDTVTIIANYQVPNFTIVPNDTVSANCPTQMVTVALNLTSGTYGPYTHLWTNGATTATVQLANNGVNGASQWYYVTSTNACGMSTTDSVLVVNNFTLPTSQINPNDTLIVDCIVDSTFATGVITNNTNGPYTYIWSNGATTSSTWIPVDATNGTFVPFSVTITDDCGFSTTSNGVIAVQQTLTIDSMFTTLSLACVPTGSAAGFVSGINDTINPTNQMYYNWSGPGPNGLYSIDAATATNISAGWYYFTATDDVCSVNDSILVNAQNSPVAIATASPNSGYAPLSVTFSNSSQNTTSYLWDFGNGQTASTTNLNSVGTTYLDTGLYIVQLIATQGPNCSDTTYLTIYVYPPPVIPPTFPPIWNIPNVFSPNGDKSNDVFFIETTNVETVHMIITNRWGNTMLDRLGPNPIWDGTTNSGAPAEDGVYFYKITLTGTDGTKVELDGFLQIVK